MTTGITLDYRFTQLTAYSQFNHAPIYPALSSRQALEAQALLGAFDSVGYAKPYLPALPQPPLIHPPDGYVRGGTAQTAIAAAAFLQSLVAQSMLEASIGARMLLGLGLFRSSACCCRHGGFGIGMGLSVNQIDAKIHLGGPSGEKDKFAVHESCRTGADNPSNLNNSPHVKLALYNILKGNHDNMPPEQLKKELESRYGIRCELTEVKGNDGRDLKALRFENGDVLVDGSGNGSFGMADYNLKGAVKDIQDRYGISPEDFDKVASAHKKLTDQYGDYTKQLAGFTAAFQGALPNIGGQPFYPVDEMAQTFAMAWLYAGR